MLIWVIIIVIILVAGGMVFLTIRNRLKTESDGFDNEIIQSLTLTASSTFDVARDKACQQNRQQFDDIEDALNDQQFAKATKLDLDQLRQEITGKDDDTDSYDLKN